MKKELKDVFFQRGYIEYCQQTTFNDEYTFASPQSGHVNASVNGRNSGWPNAANILVVFPEDGDRPIDVVAEATANGVNSLDSVLKRTLGNGSDGKRSCTFLFQSMNRENTLFQKFSIKKGTEDHCLYEMMGTPGLLSNLLDDKNTIQNKLLFRQWLDKNSTSQKEKYKDRLVRYLEFWLEEKFPGIIGNLFRFGATELFELLKVLKRLYNEPTYESIDEKEYHHAPSAAIGNYCRFLGLEIKWKNAINETEENLQKYLAVKGSLAPEDNEILISEMFQKIFFGAPGTGKSHKIDGGLFMNDDGSTCGLMSVSQDCKFRTTFHPDYDYAQFVGSYKPKKEGSSITYSFVPQVFAKAYVAAWREYLIAEKPEDVKSVYLVIEEINRGNCAQIFGDIFQLLDRKNGWSEYPIDVDSDFASYIREKVKALEKFAEYQESIYNSMDDSAEAKILSDDEFCKIVLPPNFNILATMNTSDQSLFPMDSAFKRRFDWEYVPINYAKEEAEFKIKLNSDECEDVSWLTFLKKINRDIYALTLSEDKQMGEFFIKAKKADGVDFRDFRSKILFYLWDSVYKDLVDSQCFFKPSDEVITFQSLFEQADDGVKLFISMAEYLDIKYSGEGFENILAKKGK